MEVNLDIGIITTKYVMSNQSPVMWIIHDEDGDWQFIGQEEISPSDAMVVSLGRLLEKHQEVETVVRELLSGHQAKREGLNSIWIISPIEEYYYS